MIRPFFIFCLCALSLTAAETPLTRLPQATPLTPVKKELLSGVDSAWKLNATPSPLYPRGSAASSLRVQMSQLKVDQVEVSRIPLSVALQSVLTDLPPPAPSINVVVTGGNDPDVTLSLKDTTLIEAIELMVESAGLSYELRGNTLVILPASAVGTLRTRYFPLSQSLIMRLVGAELAKAPAAPTPDGKDTSPPLYQRQAAESAIKSFFERLGVTWPEGCGMVLADGELIVTHNARTLERVEEIVARLARHRQVEIEARFMEVSEGSLDELGVQWRISNSSGNKTFGTTGVTTDGSNTLRSLSSTFNTSSVVSGSATPPQIPGGVNLATGVGDTVNFTGGILDGLRFHGVLQALSQKDGTELLSAPRVTVLSGSTANITVAQEMRYPQSYDRVNTDVGSGTTAGSILTAPTPLDFTTRNVGVQMQVTPYVEDDGSITLILQPEVTQFERFIDYGGQSVVVNGSTTQTVPSGFFQPVFSIRRLTTEVNVPSGSTVLMGGLTREESVTVKDKVPVLGNLPILGRAFRSEGSSVLKKNLVVFVTARLVE